MTGHLHPNTLLTEQIIDYFRPFGFEILSGPEIETEDYNFNLLNFPPHHPARDMQDTFYLTDGRLLRTQTSAMQIRAFKELGLKPPVRLLIPGRVYRNEPTDATHEMVLHQIEGLAIGSDITMAHLLGMLSGFLRAVYPECRDIRFRPGYFPFVEPAVEVDVQLSDGRWSEILGAGMVHPNVLKNMGLDPVSDQGFAFGVGIERLGRLITGIDDIRWAHSGDYRFLGQVNLGEQS